MANKHGRRRTFAITRFPIADGKLSTFCLSVEVTATGCTRTLGMVRAPYNDRPKVGGGRSVPPSWMNPRRGAQ